jgi:hypothetical protein
VLQSPFAGYVDPGGPREFWTFFQVVERSQGDPGGGDFKGVFPIERQPAGALDYLVWGEESTEGFD